MYQRVGYYESVLTWVGALSRYDLETAEHSARVGHGAKELARRLGLADDDVERAGCAGLLHDLGKMDVPLTILTKTAPLTSHEWEAIRRHPADGAQMVASMSEWLGSVAAAVRGHHERWDGSGYPDGLRGDRIPILARIVAIADVFDAITHVRCYRDGVFSTEEALLEITAGAGEQFDPRLVPAFALTVRDDMQLDTTSRGLAAAAAG